eukprot:SAG11_NODE_953_length_6401_cov_6.463980_2_plen_311_part_00
MCQSVKDLHDLKSTGRLGNGAGLMLEIVSRDSQMLRKQIHMLKEKVKRNMRYESLEREYYLSQKKKRRTRSNDKQSPFTKFKAKALKGLFGNASASVSSDMMNTQDKMMTSLNMNLSSMNQSMYMSGDMESGSTSGSGCCCFGKVDGGDDGDATKDAEAKKKRHLARQAERKRKRKEKAEEEVRFHVDFAGILPEALHTPVVPEKRRYRALIKQHQKELGAIAPHLVEIDIDSEEYHSHNWDKGGRMMKRNRKARLKGMVKRNKKDKMAMSSMDGNGMMVLSNKDIAQGNEDDNVVRCVILYRTNCAHYD